MHQLAQPISSVQGDALLLDARGLGYVYPDGTRALDGIDLQIRAKERIALVGHNGSGKTTLVKQLCGLLQTQQGQIEFRGKQLDAEQLQRVRLEIGLLFQDPDDQLFGHNIYEDVAFGPRNQGLDEDAVERVVRKAVSDVGLTELLFKPPHALSYGQKKRAALAGLLAMQPELLILDEPTANLDPLQEQIFLDLLKNYPGTLLLISHDLIFLYELCERVLVLDGGRVHHDYRLKELVEHRPSLREHGLDFSFRFAEDTEAEQQSVSAATSRNQETTFATAKTSLIDLKSVCYSYPDGTPALRGVDLRIEPGERVAIVGENGAGKSTLLMALLGLIPFRGDYRFAGQRVSPGKGRPVWQQTGMVFQDSADQLVCPSCYDEVAFAPRQFGIGEEEVRKLVDSALKMVKLDDFAARIPLHLSGGERKRLALASVLSLKPQLLILDEPTAGLDPQGEELLLEILQGIDATLLLVSHDIFFVRRLTERTLVMHNGQISLDYMTKDFIADKNLTSLNGLDYTYRDHCALQIRQLQHQHEHAHPHKHRHEHTHQHGETNHSHPHEHEHEHPHRYRHVHADKKSHASGHEHTSQHEYHDHPHPGHNDEEHRHPH
ncbi:MAG: energy-coupling factor transporter ATPase [Geopsychrobacter sp.]|nr:energy-coupling factor transporter ATPase [Geopsychrobacter sp.]